MFDHRLARVMHQDKINSAEIQRHKKASTSERSDGIDGKRSTIVTMIARIFSPKDMPEANLDLSALRYQFGRKAGSQ